LLQKVRNGQAAGLVQFGKAFAGHAFRKELLRDPGKVNARLAQIPRLAVPRGLSLSHALRDSLAEPKGTRNGLARRVGIVQLPSQPTHGRLVPKQPGTVGNLEVRG